MEYELKKAVDFFDKGKLSSAKEIALRIYNSKPDHFDNLRLLNFIPVVLLILFVSLETVS